MESYLKEDYPKLAYWLHIYGIKEEDLDRQICVALFNFDHQIEYTCNGTVITAAMAEYEPVDPTFMDREREKFIQDTLKKVLSY